MQTIIVVMNKVLRLLVILATLLYCWPVFAEGISPYEYGLSDAKTGEQRYQVLYKTHTKAVEAGTMVDYSGINGLEITIPEGAKSIPLTDYNDFKGVTIVVTNHTKNFFLFSYIQKSKPIDILAKDIDVGWFTQYPELREGCHLLVISDDSLWVNNRKNHGYGHTRKDILMVNNGIARNKTIMPYNNRYSSPECIIYDVNAKKVVLSNITLQRTDGNEYKTYLCDIKGLNNLYLSNIAIKTPQSDLTGDVAIRISDCTNVTLSDITIDGTYSRTDYSGYGISLNNIWNLYVTRMYGNGNWGVFGTNNLNYVRITNSKINRFDIHCYGRNVAFKKVAFFGLYNQFSSTYGTISFDRCTFDNFIPVLYETSYNAYVGHDLTFNRCTFHINDKRNYLIKAGNLDTIVNKRQELADKCWPNIKINRMEIIVEDDVPDFYLFKVSKYKYLDYDLRYISNISITRMIFVYDTDREPMNFYFSNKDVSTEKSLNMKIKKLDLVSKSREDDNNTGVVNLKMNTDNGKNNLSVKRSKYSDLIGK